jgi:hypothetical protein
MYWMELKPTSPGFDLLEAVPFQCVLELVLKYALIQM